MEIRYMMNKEQAIEHLKLIRLNAGMTGAESFKEALGLAIVSLSQPSLPSDLDEAEFKYAQSLDEIPANQEEEKMIYDAFKAGAEWRDAQIQKLPNNLDEVAEKYANRGVSSNADPYEETIAYQADKEAFKAGAEWMAGQFQKIEGELVDWYSTSDGKDYCCGVKTDEAFEVPEGFYIRKK